MSAFLIGYAIKADTATQTRKLVLMKLVDAAEEDGSNVYPSVATIARAAMCSERQVQRVLGEFCGVGLLEKVRDGVGGRGKGRPTEYRIVVERLRALAEGGWGALDGGGSGMVQQGAGSAEGTTGTIEKGDTMSPICAAEMGDIGACKRVTYEAEMGDTLMSPYPLDPSLNPSEKREGALARDRFDRLEGEKSPTATTDDGLSSEGQSVLDMIALYPAGRQDQRGQVEAAWNALTPAERQRAIDELPGWLDERTAAKLRRMFLQTYLGDKQFDLPKGVGSGPSGKGAKADSGVTVDGGTWSFKAWSREWFAHLVWASERGKPVWIAVKTARGNPKAKWACRAGEMLPAEAIERFVHVSSASDAWRAWQAWFRARDPKVVWPSWEGERWFDLPSKWPPGFSPEIDDREDANAYPAEMEI
jgi:hypothetical protein